MVTVTHVFFQISKAAQKAESLFLWDFLFCPQPELLIHGAGRKNRSFGDKNVTSGGVNGQIYYYCNKHFESVLDHKSLHVIYYNGIFTVIIFFFINRV